MEKLSERAHVQQGADVQVIHGRHDIVAPPKYGERLAARMACPCITLEGAHFLTRERGPAINALLRHIIMPDAAKVGLHCGRHSVDVSRVNLSQSMLADLATMHVTRSGMDTFLAAAHSEEASWGCQMLHGDMDVYMATDFVSDVPELAHPSPLGDVEMAVVAASAADGFRPDSFDAGGGKSGTSSANSVKSTAPLVPPASKIDRTL